MSSFSLRILIVENHPRAAAYLKMHLEGDGHSVAAVSTATAAAHAHAAGACEVLISDVRLDDGEIWDLPKRLSEPMPRLCISMSGLDSSRYRALSAAGGFHFHLRKPFLPSELDALLQMGIPA